jgi:tetratricopeptide (TPR) repeat protein
MPPHAQTYETDLTPTARRAVVVALLLLTALVYAPSLTHPFQYDDGHTIVENAALRQPDTWRAAFTGKTLSSAETAGGHYRPLTYLSYWATWRAAGLRPWAFHAGNLALHLVAVWLVIALVTRLAGNARVGLIAGAVTALHPAHGEAVFYASARAGLLATVYSLAALWCWARARDRQTTGDSAVVAWLGCALFTTSALLAKETAVALPLMLLAADALVLLPERRDTRRVSAWAWWGPYAPLAIGLVVYVIVMDLWRPVVAALTARAELGGYIGVVTEQIQAIGLAMRLFIAPWPLSVDHPLPEWPSWSAALLWALVLLAIAFAVGSARSASPSQRVAAFFAIWTLVVTLPTVLWPLNVPFQEHRAYLSHIGLAALAAFGLVHLIDARPALRRPAVVAGSLVAIVFAWLTVDRGRVWADPVRLWQDAEAHAPGSYRAHANAGLALAAAGRWDDADRAFAAARALSPDYPPALVGEGVSAQQRGDLETARARYQRAVEATPNYIPALYNLGLIAQESGDSTEAERWYQRALAINPLHAPSRLNLAALFLVQRRWDDADSELTWALAASPESPDVHYHLGLLAELTGLSDDARREYHTAERLALAANRQAIAAEARARLAALP